jgi:putative component of toxin-antitoxin plasmid stabilization module
MKASAWMQTQDSQSRLNGMKAVEVSVINGIMNIRCSIRGKRYHTYYAKSDNLVVVLPIGGKVLKRKELNTKGRLMKLKKMC